MSEPKIEDLIEASSLGTPDAKRKREQARDFTRIANLIANAEQRAYRDGYQQGFYDGTRGNPPRCEEI